MIVVDSSVWIDRLRGDATPEVARLRDIIGGEETLLVVCDTVLFEVLRGVRHDAQAARVERDLRRFRVERVAAGLYDAARAAARWRAMRAKGFTAGRVDTQIAAWRLDPSHHTPGPYTHVPPLVVLEMERLIALRQLPSLPMPLPVLLRARGFRFLPMTWEVAARIPALPPIPKDPIDRALVARSIEQNMPILTKDGDTPKYGVATIW